jgi:hypothetical protein
MKIEEQRILKEGFSGREYQRNENRDSESV